MKTKVVPQPFATLVALGIKTILDLPAPPKGPMCPEGVRGLNGPPVERGERIAIVAGKAALGHQAWLPDGLARVLLDAGLVWQGLLAAPNGTSTRVSWKPDLPLGSVVCTVRVDDALPIVGDRPWLPGPYLLNAIGGLGRRVLGVFDEGGYGICATNGTADRHPWVREHPGIDAATDQLPLGDFTPGRWGWMLSDPQPPMKACGACGGRGHVPMHSFHPCMSCHCTGRVPCDPIPCKGRPGVFELPADVAAVLA